MFSFYKIKNNIDGYCYIGTTADSISSRICDHLKKYYLFLSRWNQFYNDSDLNRLLNATLYETNPFVTKVNRMAAAIGLYGWNNFTVELLATGNMTRKMAYTVENQFIKSETKSYNVILNTYAFNNCHYIDYTKYKNAKVNMFDLEEMNYSQAAANTTKILNSYYDNLIC